MEDFEDVEIEINNPAARRNSVSPLPQIRGGGSNNRVSITRARVNESILTKRNGFELSCLARRRLNLIPNMKFQVQLRRRQASPIIRQVCQIKMKFV